jgi:hypothetical protein
MLNGMSSEVSSSAQQSIYYHFAPLDKIAPRGKFRISIYNDI